MKNYIAAALLFMLVISACSPSAPPPAPVASIPTEPGLTLIPDLPTITEALTQTLTLTSTSTCSPTPNPFISYKRQANDTCSSISVFYHVSIPDLLAANPDLKGDCALIPLLQTVLIPIAAITPHAIMPTATDRPTLAATLKATLGIKPTSIPLPTSRPIPTNPPPAPTNPPAPTSPPAQACCKHCSSGIPCGDSCIAANKTCTKAPGCACKP